MADNLVTEEDVQGIFDTDLDNLAPFINTAHNIVKQTSYDEGKRTDLELWLSAHLAAARDRRLSSKSIEGNREDYMGEGGKQLEATMYGQTVLTLDDANEIDSKGAKNVTFKHTG